MIRSRVNFLGQMRVDVPHMRAIESGGSNDFDELLSALITNEDRSYVIRGFELEMAGSIGSSASSLQLIVGGSAMLHGQSQLSGTVFQVPTGTANETLSATTNTKVDGAFTPSALNYIGLEFVRQVDDSTSIQTYLWNPTINAEIVKTLPFLETLNYKIVISSTSFASNVLPISIVETDTSNNVLSIQDRRPMLFRLGTAGVNTPDPFYEYPWTNDSEGRVENYWQSSSSLVSPFRGGDKQILSFKENDEAIKTEIKLLKGTNYWYSSAIGGSVAGLRYDIANTIMTGSGSLTHNAVTSGRMNWDQNIYLTVVSTNLKYKLEAYAAGTNVTLADRQAAYIKIVRGQSVSPQLIFTNGSAVVTSVGSISWTTNLEADDFIKVGSAEDNGYYQILTVDSTSQVTLKTVFTGTSTGINGTDAKYAYGNYRTNAAPSTDRHIKIAAIGSVPFDADTYWLMFRDDNGGDPRVYVRFLGAELEKGESLNISDGVPLAVLQYIGSAGDADSTPDYTNAVTPVTSNYYVVDGENLTTSVKRLDKTIFDVAGAALSQLRIIPHETLDNSVRITGADTVLSSGITLTQSMKNLVLSFEGAVIDFETGEVFEADGTTPLGVDFTPYALPTGESIWYAVTLTASTVNAENEVTAVLSVVPAATSEIVVADAPKAKYTKGIALGQVLITDTGGVMDSIEEDHILQLGVIGGSGGSGSGSGEIRVHYIDPISTALPTGATVTIDGVSGVNDDLVLYTNLTVGNNQIYKLSGVGVSIAWTVEDVFENGNTPIAGETVRARFGDSFAGQQAVFDGTSWKVNEFVRYFNGADYWEISSLQSEVLTDNSTGSVFEIVAANSEHLIIDYSIVRGSTSETGTISITQDGTDVSLARFPAYLGNPGVDLIADILAGDLRLRYTTTSSGTDAIIKYTVKRWSNNPGGPAGVPSYSGGVSTPVTAAGTTGDVQYKDAGGGLAADTQFKWDNSVKAINLNGMRIESLKGPNTISDNQVTPAAIITKTSALVGTMFVNYSVVRNGFRRTGTMLVSNDGTLVGFNDGFTESGATGVTFSASISGADLLISYISTSTGNDGSFQYSITYWL